MPYRDRATVVRWVAEWRTQRDAAGAAISVLDDSFVPGEDSAVVVVDLRSASTLTHIRPVPLAVPPRWVATLEPRDELLMLDHVGLRALAEDLRMLADLLTFLQGVTETSAR